MIAGNVVPSASIAGRKITWSAIIVKAAAVRSRGPPTSARSGGTPSRRMTPAVIGRCAQVNGRKNTARDVATRSS
jgi:hypothetical protein